MTEQEFKQAFIISFLATWTANEYNDACVNDRHEKLHNPPVEDAIFLADKAWEKYFEQTRKNIIAKSAAIPPQPQGEALWPEEQVCGCGHGECSICLAVNTAKEIEKDQKQVCGMHFSKPNQYCFVCNVIGRVKKRLAGEVVPPPRNRS